MNVRLVSLPNANYIRAEQQLLSKGVKCNPNLLVSTKEILGINTELPLDKVTVEQTKSEISTYADMLSEKLN